MIAFVTGATGCVGYALCRRLLEGGSFSEVRVLARGDSPDVPTGCRVFAGRSTIPVFYSPRAKAQT
jgi:uncharacterized protein YbjT (DUF2867 family)